MRTIIHWARKSQPPLTTDWIVKGEISRAPSPFEREAILISYPPAQLIKKNDILTDTRIQIVTYLKYET